MKMEIAQAITRNNYIAHHGVKGQRHGIRRWQNLDGSFTPAGYIHYGIHPREPKALNRDGSLTEYGRKRFNDVWNTYAGHRSKAEEADFEMLLAYAKSLPEFENAVHTLSTNEWANVRKQIDDIWRQPDYEHNPLYAQFKRILLEKNRKDPKYAGMTDDQIIAERNHHFQQEIESMIQDHLLDSKGLSFDQVYDENRAISEAAASSIANKTIGDVRDWEFMYIMSGVIREKANEQIWN